MSSLWAYIQVFEGDKVWTVWALFDAESAWYDTSILLSACVKCWFSNVTDTENTNRVSLKGKTEIITIDSSDFEDAGITQIKSDDDETNLQPLRDAVHQNHKVATQLRLTHKTEKPTVPERTKAFLKAHELARQQDPSKLGTILFKCELVLQKQTGQKYQSANGDTRLLRPRGKWYVPISKMAADSQVVV
jgi:hypothetical protein